MGKRQKNPRRVESTAHRMFAALGLGLGIAGTGLSLGTIYQKPSISIAGSVLGIGLAMAYLPWGRISHELVEE